MGDCVRAGLYCLALQELRLPATDPNIIVQCKLISNGWQLRYTACDTSSQGGVGFLLSPLAVKQLIKTTSLHDRALALYFRASRQPKKQGGYTTPVSIAAYSIYAPAASNPLADSLRADMFDKVSTDLTAIPKHAHVFVCGDFNAMLRKGDVDVLFSRNPVSRNPTACNAREGLIDFCHMNDLSVSNGQFRKHHRQLATHRRPNKQYVTLDYILVRRRWRTSVSNCITCWTEASSDHKMLKVTYKIRLRSLPPKSTPPPDFGFLHRCPRDSAVR